MRFQYCPLCGGRLVDKKIPDEGLVPYCVPCGRVYFQQPLPCVLALAVNAGGEVALLHQHEVAETHDVVVAGHLLSGENGEEAAAREVREELGLAVLSSCYVGSYYFPQKDMLMLGYAVQVEGDAFILSEEVDAAVWLPANLALNRLREGGPAYCLLRDYMNNRKNMDSNEQ